MTPEGPLTGASACRPAEPADAAFLLAVYAGSREAELGAVPWSPEQRAAFVALQFEAQRRHYTERFPHADHLVLLDDGAAAGRLWVDRGPDEIRVLDLALHPDHLRSEAAAHALDRLAAEADARRLPIRAHLDPADPLLGTYRSLGFTEAKSGGPTPCYERMPSPPNL